MINSRPIYGCFDFAIYAFEAGFSFVLLSILRQAPLVMQKANAVRSRWIKWGRREKRPANPFDVSALEESVMVKVENHLNTDS